MENVMELYEKFLTRLTKLANETVVNSALRKLLIEFIKYEYKITYSKSVGSLEGKANVYAKLIHLFSNKNPEDITWNIVCNYVQSSETLLHGAIIHFYSYVLKCGYNTDSHSEYLRNNSWLLDDLVGCKPKQTFYCGSNPLNIYQIKYNGKQTRVDLHASSQFIRELLKTFLNSLEYSECCYTRTKTFIYYFENSLYACDKLPESANDFTVETFKRQYRFYNKIKIKSDLHRLTSILTKFYVFLDKQYEEFKFDINGGIDRNFLVRTNFSRLYDAGYRVVVYNRSNSIPEINRWLIAPNEESMYSTALKENDYMTLNFLRVKDITMRDALKKWYWYSDLNIYSRDTTWHEIAAFLEFIYTYQKGHSIFNGRNLVKFDLAMITAFRASLYKYSNRATRNGHIKSAKTFINFLRDNNLCEIQYEALEYLKLFKKESYKGNPILKEDMGKIVTEYKRLAQGNDQLPKLLLIILTLSVVTNMRISEVLGLRRDCLVETMKKRQYALRVGVDEVERPILSLKRKGSRGALSEYSVNNYIVRYIQLALELTEGLVEQADSVTKQYLFLRQSSFNKRVQVVTKGTVYSIFKKIVNRLDLKGGPYTVYNLRDTFMTYLYDEGIKEGRNIFDIHIATGHKSMETTIKHYRSPDIRNYLEAMYHVVIGEVDINGTVACDINDVIYMNHSIVNGNCGYCQHGSCDVLGVEECLICKYFVVTIDRIPYFILSISEIDKRIANETIDHEKEHLVTLKRLYVAYLEKLYQLRSIQ